MKILSIEVEGFLSIGKAFLPLDRKGTVLVEGVNHDSPADSNGAGKSSIFEALHWCLYGSTRRGGMGADDIINRHTKTGTLVVVLFEKRGMIYTVKRARKSKEHGTGLWVYDGGGGDLTKGTVKDTQAALEEIIGLSQVAFQKSVYFGQGDVKQIAEMTDGELKIVFEQALGLSQVPVDYQKVVGYRKGLEGQIAAKISARNTAQIILDSEMNSLAEKKAALENYSRDRAEKLEVTSRDIREVRAALNMLMSNARALEEEKATLKTEAAGLKGKLEGMAEVDMKVGGKLDAINADLTKYSAILPTILAEKSKVIKEAEEVKAGAGSKCGYCGLVMDEGAVKASLGRIEGKLAKLAEAEEKVKTGAAEANAEKEKISGTYRPFKEKMVEIETRYTETKTRLNRIDVEVASVNTAAMAKKADLCRLEEVFERIKTSDDGEETLKKAVDIALNAVSTKESEISSLEDEINGLSVKTEVVKMLEAALGNGGLKSLVFERVTPAINRYSNEFLSMLDPGVSVEISTVSYLKTGEAREKFSVAVESRAGSKGYAGHSGGEKQKINLAVSLAFNRLMRESSKDVPDMLILDEPFESLDAGSSEQVVDLLSGLDANNVFLITHNQAVKDLVPEKVTIEKRGGISSVC